MAKASRQAAEAAALEETVEAAASGETVEQAIVEEQVIDKDPGLKTRAYKDMNYKPNEEVSAAILDGE
jgi:hypothetical protein